MKKLLLINSVCGILSTGRICLDIAKQYEADGYDVKIAYGRDGKIGEGSEKYAVRIGNDFDVKFHALYTRITDKHGLGSKRATRKFLKWADEYDPDIVWLHNIHGYYINYELLFDWIKSRPQMKVRWTLHDCWAFTGHCVYFSYYGCYKWKESCYHCPQKNTYPESIFFDGSKENYRRKERAFKGLENLEIIVPSKWLASLVKTSFLQNYSISVKYNEINRTIFHPVKSDFRIKYGISQNSKIVLGVASAWSARKGLNDFIELEKMIKNDHFTDFQIVLVGLKDKQKKIIPNEIICVPLTNDPKQLASIYSEADLFFNPSKEETFGLTTLEAICCGTRAAVYRGTACEEIVLNAGQLIGDGIRKEDEELVKYAMENCLVVEELSELMNALKSIQ